jgi:FAD:protein FMN transferase
MRTLIILLFITHTTLLLAQPTQPVRLSGEAQGTTYHITYYDSKGRNFQPQIDKLLIDFDKSVSTYLPTSIISKINTNQPNVKADKYFKTCFNKAKEVWASTYGAFDPTVYPIVNAWGFGPGKKQTIVKTTIDSMLAFVNFNLIALQGSSVVKKDPRVQLDFNAFAQGYSVDVVAEFLNSKKINAYIVEIGGELKAKGTKPDGSKWTVGIEKPIDNQININPLKALVKLENLALATSGDYRRYVLENGVKYAHHIDPKTGYPTKNNMLSATLFAQNCIDADANATGILVMGLDKAIEFLKLHTELQAYIIYSDEKGEYKVYETPGIKGIVSEAAPE